MIKIKKYDFNDSDCDFWQDLGDYYCYSEPQKGTFKQKILSRKVIIYQDDEIRLNKICMDGKISYILFDQVTETIYLYLCLYNKNNKKEGDCNGI